MDRPAFGFFHLLENVSYFTDFFPVGLSKWKGFESKFVQATDELEGALQRMPDFAARSLDSSLEVRQATSWMNSVTKPPLKCQNWVRISGGLIIYMILGRTLGTRSPSSALLPLFFGEGSPAKIDYRKQGYPYSILSAGGPSLHDSG